ncbi:protein CURVATURE THYLAKOID 1C, chloroplastic [Brassica rapa]|uniref:Cyanobacterial aminoacyl-tRNA synthetase CAAD domain-containing protein n=1 Tax=Brassica campestris TaxID=3711 RepID=M4DR11_BRACM|nr:protein CURVATURE THYLAKOID 1C, chloroplastic [Brassica rapa]
MASVSATLPPPLLLTQRKPNLTSVQKLPFSLIRDRRSHSMSLMVKASGKSSESSDLDVISSIQNVWDKSEDRLGLIGLSFAAIVALWASLNIITAIDKLPVISSGFELVGILFSTWFTYRYLLFKPDREELSQIVKKSVADILGQ